MADTFLQHTAKYLLQHYPQQLHDIAVVLPGQRACLHLKHRLVELTQKPLLLPQILSIEDFIGNITNTEIIDPLTLTFEFYKIHATIKEQAGTFEEFIIWSQTLLNDFNEIDQNLVDAKMLYAFLDEAKLPVLENKFMQIRG